jgi:hypothetical protein
MRSLFYSEWRAISKSTPLPTRSIFPFQSLELSPHPISGAHGLQ